MALTETLNLDISAALSQLSRLEAQLAELTSGVTIPVNVTEDASLQELQREIDRVDSETVDVSVDVDGVQAANVQFDRLNQEIDQTEDELRQVSNEAQKTGRELDQAGTRGAQTFSRLRSSIGGVGAGLIAAFGVRAVGQGINEAIQAASNLEESISKTTVVFGAFSDEIRGIAETAPQALGLSTQAALEATATFGNLFTALGLTQQGAAELSPQIVQLGADLASFNNITVDEAILSLRSGLVGEAEPLRRLGVAINAAVVDQKALELGLVDAAGAVTEAGKVQARYALILEQTTNAQGDFARTSDGLANSMRTTAAEIENAQAEVGQAFAPALQALLPLAAETATSISVLALSFGELVGSVPEGAAALAQLRAEVGELEDPLQALITLIVTANDELGNISRPGNEVQLDLGTEEIANFIRELGFGRDEIDRLRQSANREFLIRIGFTEENIDELVKLLEQDVVAAAIEARDALIHSAEGGDRFVQAMKGVTSFSPELARFRSGLEEVDRVVRSEAEAFDILSFHADQSGLTLNELLQNQDALAPSLQNLVGSLSASTLVFLEQVDAINELDTEIGLLPQAMDAAAAALEDSEGNIVEDFSTFFDNLQAELAKREAFESNLAILRALGLDDLATVFDEAGVEAAAALADAVADPGEAAAANAALTGAGQEQANAYIASFEEAIAGLPVTQALVQNIIDAAAQADSPEVRAALLALAESLQLEIPVTFGDLPESFSPEAVRARNGSGGGGGSTGDLVPSGVTVTQNFYTEPAATTQTQQANQWLGAVVGAAQ